MIGEQDVRAIIGQYEKFGWEIHCVLITDELRKHLGEAVSNLFDNARIETSDIDAARFTRPSTGGRVAWELRRLSELPYALIAVVEKNIDTVELAEVLRDKEDDLRERVNKAPPAA